MSSKTRSTVTTVVEGMVARARQRSADPVGRRSGASSVARVGRVRPLPGNPALVEHSLADGPGQSLSEMSRGDGVGRRPELDGDTGHGVGADPVVGSNGLEHLAEGYGE